MPVAWSKNSKGMSPTTELDEEDQEKAQEIYKEILYFLGEKSAALAELKLHKQYANRVLELFAHIDVVLTATDFNNFFKPS